jgi:hypothetical protein
MAFAVVLTPKKRQMIGTHRSQEEEEETKL